MHRETKDLDLFATPEVDIDDGARALRAAAAAIAATAALSQESPDFRRFSVSRGDELTLVDLAIDRSPQLVDRKPSAGAIRLDALDEIGANKLCTLLGHAEVRDLFDLKVLMDRGHRLEDLLAGARAKQGGVDPSVLAWVLGDFAIGARSPLPPEVTVEDLDAFRNRLVERLSRMALPAD